jgi:hypothetical protein
MDFSYIVPVASDAEAVIREVIAKTFRIVITPFVYGTTDRSEHNPCRDFTGLLQSAPVLTRHGGCTSRRWLVKADPAQ